MTQSLSEILHRRAAFLEAGRGVVMDADTHISDPASYPGAIRKRMAATIQYFHGRPISAEELVLEMDGAGVDVALCWQNPSATTYGTDPSENFDRLLAANRYVYEAANRWPTRILPAGWIDPKALGVKLAVRLAEICSKELGFCLIKMNPAQNAFMINSADVLECVDAIADLGAVPAFHFGADTPYTPPDGFLEVARRHPHSPIVGVHMGGGGAGYLEAEHHYERSRVMGLEQANIFFIESAKRDTHIESDLLTYAQAGEPAWRRLAVGSDAPYGRMSWNFGGYRAMLSELTRSERNAANSISSEIADGFLGDNFRVFYHKALRRLCERHYPALPMARNMKARLTSRLDDVS